MVNCLSLFSGAGIGETYLRGIGIKLVIVNEIDSNKRLLIPRYIERRLGKEYRIKYGVVDSQYYGLPQSRKRLIFLLSRKDTKIKWDFPEQKPIITTTGISQIGQVIN